MMQIFDFKNMLVRTCSALIMVSIFIIGVFWYNFIFNLSLYLIVALMAYEWYQLSKKQNNYCWLIGAMLTISFFISVLFITNLEHGEYLLLTLFCCVSTVDVAAMIGGKILQGPKLAPIISPNKTISGLICGCFFALITVYWLKFIPDYQLPNNLQNHKLLLIITTILISLTSQISDLLVSFFKRRAKVKDTGQIIPGHGGVLDRFDGFILTSILVAIYFFINN